jgi:hypothetical protein
MYNIPLVLLQDISETFEYVATSTREFIYHLANDKKFTQDLVFTSVASVWSACVTKTFLNEDKTLPISLIRLSSKALLAGSIAVILGVSLTA